MKYTKIISMLLATAMIAAATTVLADDNSENINNNTVLINGVDYTLEYKDNIQPGTATVTVRFIGNYDGEKEQTFNIVKKKSSGGGGGGSSIRTTPSPAPSASPLPQTSPKPTDEPQEYEHNAYIQGYGDGSFVPDGNITRAEAAAILYRVLEANDEKTDITFPDLENGAWYISDVQSMANSGVIKGYDDGTFKPKSNITRAEFVAMLMRTKTTEKFTELPFTDITADMWSVDYIYSAYKAGYIDGYMDNTFKPNNFITRAEAVKIINGVLGRTDFGNETNPFSDVPSAHWAYKHILEASVSHNVE